MGSVSPHSQLADDEVRALRLESLLLTDARGQGRGVGEIVEWFGAMQAQDAASGLWSLGVRMPGATEQDVTDALERREALRTWPMRGTVHLVPARDAHWMLEHLGAKPLAAAAKRREVIGLSEDVAERAVDVLGEALAGGKRLTRAECIAALAAGGIDTPGQRGYHLLWYASQKGVTCIAPHVGTEQTFVLLDEWVPDPVRPGRDEALALIAERYFRSHGPATVKDFSRWTGLGVTDGRRGIAAVGDRLVEVSTTAGPMIVARDRMDAGAPGSATTDAIARPAEGRGLVTPPGFDEFMLGYGDRSLLVDPDHFAAVVPGNNGVFQSTIVRDGRVVGIWKRTNRTAAVIVAATDLAGLGKRERGRVEAAFAPYGRFVGRSVEVRWA